jgi:hypothetical protein
MKRIDGRIVPDPVLRLPAGAKFGFKPETFPIATPSGEYTLDNWHYYNGVLLHLIVMEGRSAFVHGSAVLVAPGVALAARHVLEPFGSRFCIEGGASLTCGAITSSQHMMWHCRKITFVDNSDLAVLVLSYASQLPQENIFSIAAITSRLPKIGEEVTMVGFVAAEDEFLSDPAECPIRGQVKVSVGKISDRYPEGRDRGMISWPVIEIASSASGGMSGGPYSTDMDVLLVLSPHRMALRTM